MLDKRKRLLIAAAVASYYSGAAVEVVVTAVRQLVPPVAPASGWSTDAVPDAGGYFLAPTLDSVSDGWSLDARLDFAGQDGAEGWKWNP